MIGPGVSSVIRARVLKRNLVTNVRLQNGKKVRFYLFFSGYTFNTALGGGFSFLDYIWEDWGGDAVPRVKDLMDISHLRGAKIGIDSSYKT